ncbi:MAG: HMA2 domain-containing protein [Syntrophobacter sp.]
MQKLCKDQKGAGMTCYLHHVPGRIRVKTPIIKGNTFRATEIEELLRNVAGVYGVSANTLTGSILINYDVSMTTAGKILELFGKEANFDLASAESHEKYVDERLSQAGEKIGKAVFGIMIGKMLEGTPLSLLAAMI